MHLHSNERGMAARYWACTVPIAMQPLASGIFLCCLQTEPCFSPQPSGNTEIAEQSCTARQD